ncbi:hypothetical protein MMC25_002374 [Agyrium rufum]|nr:hypothetical protein [Agyrium rufum]
MEIPTALRFQPAAEKDRFVVIETVGATWFPQRYDPATEGDDGKQVVLYFHGGAFVMGEGRSMVAGFACNTYATTLDAHVLSVSYRLSCNPKFHFPAALQDAVTAYNYLLDQLQIPADRIILAGDSSGAKLAISLLRYIAENNSLLPWPAAGLLFSPRVDLAASLDSTLTNRHRHYPTDYMPGNFTAWGAHAYVPPNADPSGPYFSPLGHPFLSSTPLFVVVGS